MRKALLALFAGILMVANTYGASLETANFPSLISTLNSIDTLTLWGEKVPLETQEVRERFEKELLYYDGQPHIDRAQ